MDFQFDKDAKASPSASYTSSTDRYIYQYWYVLTNSVGDKQVVKSAVFDNPYKMAIALIQSYKFLEQRLLADLALVRRPTADLFLDLIKLRISINRARELITRICTEPDFPGQIIESFQVLKFTPEPGSFPLRAAIMEVEAKSIPENATSNNLFRANSHSWARNNFTPVEYKFINQYMRFLRAMPQFPVF
jgi:hypothetical protein